MKKDKEKSKNFRVFLERGSFYSLLLRNYAGLTLMALVCGFLILVSLIRITEAMLKVPKTELLMKQENLLKEERYRLLSSRVFTDQTSYLEVLDEDCRMVYSDQGTEQNRYSKEELSYIPELMGDTYVVMEPIADEEGAGKTMFIQYGIDRSDTESYLEEIKGVVILDAGRNVIYSSMDIPEDRLTEKELNYWYGAAENGYSIQKYAFTTAKGEKRILLLHISEVSDAVYDNITSISRAAVPVFIVCFLLLMLLFVFRMNRKVKQPLEILNAAMQDLSAGIRNGEIHYSGPKEFEQICENFNRMAERLSESERQQQKMAEDKQKMLADISHDLKTPITVIQGYSKAICDGVIAEESQQKYLTTIYRKSNTLAELINSFYEYSRLEHPQFELVKDTGDVCEYLREYIAGVYGELEVAGFTLSIELPEQEVRLNFDHLQLKRVFENIIANSLKHNERGTGIFVSLKAEEKEVVIRLGDNGTGIPEALRDTVFDPFVVGDISRNSKHGTGLGLAISKKIVEAHGGTIVLLGSAAGGITTIFEIRIPF